MILVLIALLGLWSVYLGAKVRGALAFRGVALNKYIAVAISAAVIIVCFATRSVLFATVLYSSMLFLLGDLIGLVGRGSQGVSSGFQRLWQGGLTPVALALVITVFAWYSASHPVNKSYTLTLDKGFGSLSQIKIVMLSDTHMGTVVKEDDLAQLVSSVNGQQPDIICLAGDIFDESTPDALRGKSIEAFAGLKAEYGVYYISGNHDAYLRHGEAEAWQASGVTLLDDKCLLVADSFYLAGRADGGHQSDVPHMPIEQVLAGADKAYPVIMLDHRPGWLEEAQGWGVDLQLSGHTHAGQLFPFGFISGLVNKVNYGHKTFGDFNIIVTSGYGVWGFPARTSGQSEYVTITLLPA